MSHEELKHRALDAGLGAFGPDWTIDGWSIAPGRLELIGNHTDYNGGPVLAAAIDRVIVLGAGPIPDAGKLAVVAPDASDEVATCTIQECLDWRSSEDESGPIVYLKGIVAALLAREIPVQSGLGLAYVGDIPPAFGMSSSAAFCLATILALTAEDIPARDMVAIAREAEHRAGAMVGAMDQSASAAGNVIVFDGRDNSFQEIQPDLGDLVFAVASSGVDRSLRTSSYGTRVKESERARELINAAFDTEYEHLAEVIDIWDDVAPRLSDIMDETLAKRTRHVITESMRVREAEAAVRNGDWIAFGKLMNASGDSSAEDYEISHPVVEELVHLLRSFEGVLGARMMGGGEGGPALVLMEREEADSVAAKLAATFYAEHDIPAGQSSPFQVCQFGPGAHREPYD